MPEFTAEELKNKTPEQLAELGERNNPLSAEGILIKEEWERRRIEEQRSARTPKSWHETFIGKIIVIVVGGIILFLVTMSLGKHSISPISQQSVKQTPSAFPSQGDERVPLSQDRPPKNQLHQKQSKIDITAFDSKTEMVLYNMGDRDVFLSHLSLRSQGFGYSGAIIINKTIKGKSRLVHNLKIPTMDLSKWATRNISEDSWKKLLHERNLSENECIQWHFFVPDDSGYQTIKRFHGSNFHEVPIDATLYFRSEQDNQQNSQDVKVFAVPFLNQACVAPNGTFTF
jgi:hypothetical protein